jgi:hypothetical protein
MLNRLFYVRRFHVRRPRDVRTPSKSSADSYARIIAKREMAWECGFQGI